MKEPRENTSPQARALREAAQEWNKACDADDLNGSDPSPSTRRVDKANASLLEAAVAYADRLREVDYRKTLRLPPIGEIETPWTQLPDGTLEKTSDYQEITVAAGIEITFGPVRYRCLLCKRDKFTKPTAHKCNGQYRRRGLRFESVVKALKGLEGLYAGGK